MKKLVVLFVIFVATISCSSDSSESKTLTLSMKVNGIYKESKDITVISGKYYQGHRYIISGTYGNPSEGFVLDFIRDVKVAKELVFLYNVYENSSWRGYQEEDGNPLNYTLEINSSKRLKGTFYGTLIGNQVDPILITEGKFDISL